MAQRLSWLSGEVGLANRCVGTTALGATTPIATWQLWRCAPECGDRLAGERNEERHQVCLLLGPEVQGGEVGSSVKSIELLTGIVIEYTHQ